MLYKNTLKLIIFLTFQILEITTYAESQLTMKVLNTSWTVGCFFRNLFTKSKIKIANHQQKFFF